MLNPVINPATWSTLKNQILTQLEILFWKMACRVIDLIKSSPSLQALLRLGVLYAGTIRQAMIWGSLCLVLGFLLGHIGTRLLYSL